MVMGPNTRELITAGHLTDYEIVLPASDLDVTGIAVTGTGDFSPKGLRAAVEKSHIVGDVVENYQRFADGTRACVFATDVAAAEAMAGQFNAAGVPAACVSGVTPDGERAARVRAFRDGTVRVLVSVDIFDEGFDLPAIETVIMARPTWSLSKYLQQIGRGLRTMPGKDRALIIDHVSNVKRHGLPDAPRAWTLDDRERRGKAAKDPDLVPVTACPECLHAYERIYKACPYCGHEPEPASCSVPEMVDGDLTLLDRDTLERLRVATVLESPDSVATRAGHAGGEAAAAGARARQRERIEAQSELRDAIAQWAGYRRAEGRDDSQSYRLFFHRFGMSVPEALAMKRADMVNLTETLNAVLNASDRTGE
jgi:DNA repair protein RadD